MAYWGRVGESFINLIPFINNNKYVNFKVRRNKFQLLDKEFSGIYTHTFYSIYTHFIDGSILNSCRRIRNCKVKQKYKMYTAWKTLITNFV